MKHKFILKDANFLRRQSDVNANKISCFRSPFFEAVRRSYPQKLLGGYPNEPK